MRKRMLIWAAVMMTVHLLARTEAANGQGPSIVSPPAHSDPVCDPNGPPTARPYDKCALWLDDQKLRRGANGDVIAIERYRPMAMRGLVAGDSAKYWAGRYETDAWIAKTFRDLGLFVATAAYIAGRHQRCSAFCINGGPGHGVRVADVASLSLAVLSLPFTKGARRAGSRAVWWNNALLLR